MFKPPGHSTESSRIALYWIVENLSCHHTKVLKINNRTKSLTIVVCQYSLITCNDFTKMNWFLPYLLFQWSNNTPNTVTWLQRFYHPTTHTSYLSPPRRPSIFSLYRMSRKSQIEHSTQGIRTFLYFTLKALNKI